VRILVLNRLVDSIPFRVALHHYVEDDDIGPLLNHLAQALSSGVRLEHHITLALKKRSGRCSVVLIIVNYEYLQVVGHVCLLHRDAMSSLTSSSGTARNAPQS